MDDLINMLGGRSGGSIQQLARQFGISDEQAEGAVRGLAPALTGALGKNAASPGGLESLLGALQKGQHQRYVDEPAALAEETTVADGNAILGHLLGSKDESRRVAAAASEGSGLDVGMLKQMLPLVASLLMGSVGGQANKSGALSGGNLGGLASVLQGLGAGGAGGGLGDMLGGAMGGGGGGAMGGSSSTSGGGGLLGGLLGRFLKR